MPSAFVPFLKSGGKTTATANGSPVPPTSDSAAASGAFAALVPHGTATAPHPAGKPVVSLQKDGDRVTHIRVHCACGEVIELECAY